MSRYVWMSGHQQDAIVRACEVIEQRIAEVEEKYRADVKEYELAMKDKAEGEARGQISGWWNRRWQHGGPRVPDTSADAADLLRLRELAPTPDQQNGEG